MIDVFGRKINYVRLSLTDRCNLNCVYCMPKGQSPVFLQKDEIMSVDEIYKICLYLSKIGIDTIKLTGGEPLLREDFEEVVKKIKTIDEIKNITLTTNGTRLEKYMDFLHEQDIKNINISLDSLSPQKYKEITNFKLDKVVEVIKKIKKYNFFKIKINVVPIDISKEDISNLVDFTQENDIKLRFIEMMPIGYGNRFNFISSDEIISMISEKYGDYKRSDVIHGNGPAVYYSFSKLKTDIGFISAMSHMFCDSCNRVRISCDGKIKPCLNYEYSVDIRKMMLQGVEEDIIVKKIADTIYNKPKSHSFLEGLIDNSEMKSMYQIGG